MDGVGAEPCPQCERKVSVKLPKCPYCAHQIREPQRIIEAHSFPGRQPDPQVLARIAAMREAQELPRNPAIRPPTPITGPLSAAANLVQPMWLTGPMRTVEIFLTVLAAPLLLMAVPWLLLSVKRWGRIPLLDILIPSAFTGVFVFSTSGRSHSGTLWTIFAVAAMCFAFRQALRLYARSQT